MYKAKYNNLQNINVGDSVAQTVYGGSKNMGVVVEKLEKTAEDGTKFIMIKIDSSLYFDANKNSFERQRATIWTSELYERPIEKINTDAIQA